MTQFANAIATLGPIGKRLPASGTAGSFVALPFGYYLLQISWMSLLFASILCLFIGVWSANHYGQTSGKKDASEVIIDEVAGQWITMLFIPATLGWVLAAFVAFRLFDILKPGPVKLAEQLKDGIGVMADDVVAAMLAGMVLLVLQVVIVLQSTAA